MFRSPLSILLLLSILITSCSTNTKSLEDLIDEQLNFAIEQYKGMDKTLPPDMLPRSTNPDDGTLVTSGSRWWTSGFYPGTLWYLYEYSMDEEIKELAMARTALVEKEQYNTGTHDLGFMINDSYGHALRLTGNQALRSVMINGAYSLLSRFNETVGCIRSWDHGSYTFPVIIDNMMNLEYLMWAFRETGDSAFYKASISHTETTMKNHFRDDFSTYHLVDYDTLTGNVIRRQTVQGYADESAWARGQAWGFYGFITMYRDTKDDRYLQQAVKIADLMITNPNMPEDGVPYWDFNAPDIPDAKRDASAGAILASGLIELSQYLNADASASYLAFAEKIVRSLSLPRYRAELSANNNFILMHSVGHLPNNSEVDVPLTYADYYFVEALMRLRDLGK